VGGGEGGVVPVEGWVRGEGDSTVLDFWEWDSLR